jgi:hypothetical protein
VTYGHGQTVITTRTSGGPTSSTAPNSATNPTAPSASGGPQTQSAPPVTTHAS